MSRHIPDHPPKGSAEAYAWAERMRAARQKKARLKQKIREAGLKTEQEFFGSGGPLAPRAIQKRKLNPGEKWHEGMSAVAARYRKDAPTQTEKHIYAGMEIAHKDSASAARKLGLNPKRVRSRKGMVVLRELLYGNKFAEIRQVGAGTFNVYINNTLQGVYRTLDEARELVRFYATSLGINNPKPKRFKKNPIAIYNPSEVAGTIYNNAIEIKAKKTGGPLKGHYKHVFGKNVKILGLKDGTVLLQHKDGKPLWITRKDYERSGRNHS